MENSTPTRVAYIYVSLATGGAERHLLNIVSLIDRNRFLPSVVCLSAGGEIADAIRDQGVSVDVLGLNAKRLWTAGSLRAAASCLKAGRFDIVHTHMYHANTYGRLAAVMAGVPHLVATVHTTHGHRALKQRIVNRLLDRRTDRTIVVSGAGRQALAGEGIAGEKIVVIHNGVDERCMEVAAPRAQLRAGLALPGDAKVICSVARLSREKRHGDLLLAFSRVRQEMPGVRLIIAGGGEMKEALQNQVRGLGLDDSVKMLGERKDIPELLHLSDLFVLASGREGTPLSVLEAMACGLPVIASRVGGVGELLGEDAGVLFAAGDVEQLAAAMLGCLRDDQGSRQMGENGRRRMLAMFSAKKMVQRLETVYEECLSR